MNRHSEECLEFDQVRRELANLCLSQEGGARITEQGFYTDEETLHHQLIKVRELRILLEEGRMREFDFPPLDWLVEPIVEGSLASGEDLIALGRFISSALRLSESLKQRPVNREDYTGVLESYAEEIPMLSNLVAQITSTLDPNGEILDSCGEVRAIKSAIESLKRKIHSAAYGYLKGNRAIWQTELPTQRDGRTVLPLRAEYRGEIRGIIREVSNRGGTLFMEPEEIVEGNNQLAVEQGRLETEYRRILRGLTAQVRCNIDECRQMIAAVAEIDTVYARSRYAMLHNCSTPEIRECGFKFVKASHPALGSGAVPIDVELPRTSSQLIITGPNAGGKTVTLKTLGLFTMMHQFGMEIPLQTGSSIAVVGGIFVDIGDDQSIADSLSTFSGHVGRIGKIMRECDQNSLILLDELGGGTDLDEGTALAMAILDWFHRRGSTVVVTTHLSGLKNYGDTREGRLNASVSFDNDALIPTYKILHGIPGESHALTIAEASGVGSEVIREAENYLDRGETQVAEMIRQLRERRSLLIVEERDLDVKKRAIEQERERIATREERVAEAELKLQQQEYRELSRYVRESRRTLENMVADLKKGEITREKTSRVKEMVADLTAKQEEVARELHEEQNKRRPPAPSGGELQLEEGMEVTVVSNGKSGLLIRKRDSENWLVAVGPIKLTLPTEEIVPTRRSTPRVSISHDGARGKYVPMELDLRGMRLEDALRRLEQHLDDAIVSGLSRFSVIHGLGEGVLQSGVRSALSQSTIVKSYGYAHPDSGGYGKTEVVLVE